MNYLIAAYLVFWAVSFALVVSMALRQRRLRSDLALLRQLVEDEDLARRDA